MSVDQLSPLARQQAALVAALAARAVAPDGFDPSRLAAATDALARKRMAAVARAWPCLAHALDDRFAASFAAFAAGTPLPVQGGPLADGRAFARWLKARRELPDAGALEALAVDLQHVSARKGLMRRRGPVVKFARLAQRRRLVVALRLLWLGDYWFSIPLPGRSAFLRATPPNSPPRS